MTIREALGPMLAATVNRYTVTLFALLVGAILLAGCASYGEPYGGDGYRGTVAGRDGSEWYRCRVRDGYRAWCRADG